MGIGMIKRIGKRYILLLTLLAGIMGIISGCAKKDAGESFSEKNVEEDKIVLYYIDNQSNSLVTTDYELVNTDLEAQVNEMLLGLTTSKDKAYEAPLAGPIGIIDVSVEDGTAVIDFENTYNYIEPADEILARAAIVKTVTQLNGVNEVVIMVNSSPYLDASGCVVGPMSADMFVVDTSTNYDFL